MTAHDADVDHLREQYRDVVELDRRPEGIRYSATLHDGTPVVVVAIARDLGESVSHPERFIATLEKAASIQLDSMPRPLSWGRTASGLLHVAYARSESTPLTPGALSPSDVASIGLQLAVALRAAHDAGLLHGAITSWRISRRDGVAQLSGFGLFAALTAGGLGLRAAAAALGESQYMSPEQQSGEPPDERSDVYSLGASLYELLTGKAPYGGRTTSYLLAAVLSDSSEPDTGAEVASAVVEAVVRAIEQAPDDRWPTAAAFANALSIGAARDVARKGKAIRARGCLPTATVAVTTALVVIGALARG
jgi:serine/threonine protein kinase